MDQKLLLIKCITLAFHESKLQGMKGTSCTLMTSVLEHVRPPENVLEYDETRDIIIGLISTVKWMLEQTSDINSSTLIQRIQVIAGKETYLVESLRPSITSELSDDQRRHERLSIISELSGFQSMMDIRSTFRDFQKKLMYSGDESQFVNDFEEFRARLDKSGVTSAGASVMDKMEIIDLDDLTAAENCFKKGIELTSNAGIMRLGQQGLNAMLGEEDGLRRGNFYMIGAMSHNGKSLSLKTWPVQVAKFNKPYLLDETKKPLILYLSFEDNNQKTYQEMYKYLYENKYNKTVNAKLLMESGELTVEEAAKFIRDECQQNGFKFIIQKAVGAEFSYIDLINMIDYYEGMGYEICLLSIDYIDMMNRRHCAGDRDESKTTSLIRNIRQNCESKLITVLSAHQLSDAANALARDGEENLARSVAERGMWKGCRTLHTEIDVEVVQHIVRPGDGYAYMTYMRGKHRGIIAPTPEDDKFVVYRFKEFGGLGEDIDTASEARRTVGGGTVGNGSQQAFWDV